MKIELCNKLGLQILTLTFLALVLTSCGGKEPENAGIGGENNGGSASTKISKADYIGMVSQIFGYEDYESTDNFFPDVSVDNKNYDAIQACAEWKVIPSGDMFRPDQEATLEFALATAVRAIGISDIGLDEDQNDEALSEFYVNNIAQLDRSDLNSGLSENTGKQILQYALEYENNLELPQKINVEFQPGIKEADDKIVLPVSGSTGILLDNHSYVVGDIVYFAETQTYYPKGIRITDISGDQFSFESVSVEEVFSRLEISGTFDGEIVNAFSASDNVSILEEEIYYPQARVKNPLPYATRYPYGNTGCINTGCIATPLTNGVKMDVGKDHATFSAVITENGLSAELLVGIKNIKITTDYKHGMTVLNPEKVKLNIKYDTVIESAAEFHTSHTIPLGVLELQIWGPLFVKVTMMANVGADGKVELSYSIHNTSNLEWRKGWGVSQNFTAVTESNMEGKITLTAEVTTLADLTIEFWGDHSLANAQATVGVVIIAKEDVDLLGDYPTCIDVFGYVPLRWGVNQKGCMITSLNDKWKKRGVLWDSKTSEITVHMHWEDGSRTPNDKCLRDKGREVVQEREKTDGFPLSEYDYFDFAPISFDFIEMKEYIAFINPGDQYELQFDSIPGNYTQNTLSYTVENSSVCSVSSGVVTGLKAGGTLVKVSTPDGMFSTTIVVIVNYDYSLDDELQSL